MTDSRKKRLSMLDSLAAAGAAAVPPGPQAGTMMTANRALRSARDAVDSHHVWDLDPDLIDDNRVADRLEPTDVADLRAAIEANGQTVPILVRRHPDYDGRYLLVYGRRRLEAIRDSEKVIKIKALVANLDDRDATRAQISENMARRDLTFIEKALFARELIESGFGTQTQVAEVLTVSKSSISMALAVVERITPDLARAIGPAPGIGRPRWEALAKSIEEAGLAASDPDRLRGIADAAHGAAAAANIKGQDDPEDPSVAAFEAVAQAVAHRARKVSKPLDRVEKEPGFQRRRAVYSDGERVATLNANGNRLRLDFVDDDFARWLEIRADEVLQDLHARFKTRNED